MAEPINPNIGGTNNTISQGLIAGASQPGIAQYHPQYIADPYDYYAQNVRKRAPATLDEQLALWPAPEFGESLENYTARIQRLIQSGELPVGREGKFLSQPQAPPSGVRAPLPGESYEQYEQYLLGLQQANLIPSGVGDRYYQELAGDIFPQNTKLPKDFDPRAQAAYFARVQAPPLPHHVNPIVWNALGPVGQQLTLGAAESLGFDADEYEFQFNASRPQGTAPRQIQTRYAAPRAMF